MILFRSSFKTFGRGSLFFMHFRSHNQLFYSGVYLMEICIFTTYFSLLYFHKNVEKRRKVVLLIIAQSYTSELIFIYI